MSAPSRVVVDDEGTREVMSPHIRDVEVDAVMNTRQDAPSSRSSRAPKGPRLEKPVEKTAPETR